MSCRSWNDFLQIGNKKTFSCRGWFSPKNDKSSPVPAYHEGEERTSFRRHHSLRRITPPLPLQAWRGGAVGHETLDWGHRTRATWHHRWLSPWGTPRGRWKWWPWWPWHSTAVWLCYGIYGTALKTSWLSVKSCQKLAQALKVKHNFTIITMATPFQSFGGQDEWEEWGGSGKLYVIQVSFCTAFVYCSLKVCKPVLHWEP